MAKKANVSVTWETIQDGKTKIEMHFRVSNQAATLRAKQLEKRGEFPC